MLSRLIKKLLLVLLVLIVAAYAVAFWFMSSQGRKLFVAELERATGRKVTVQDFRLAFPSAFSVRDLNVNGLIKAKKAFVAVDTPALLRGILQVASVELNSPEINIDLTPAALDAKVPAVLPAVLVRASFQGAGIRAALKPVAVIGRVKVRGGTVMVQAPATGKTWIFDNVQADIRDLALDGTSIRTAFTVSASLARMNVPFVGHMARANGWVNWQARDMDASVQAFDEGGRVGLSAELKSRSNDCEVKGRARLSSSQSAQASGKKPKMVESTVLDILSSLQSDIEADFSFHTLLDRFEIGKVNISGNIMTGLQSGEISGNIVGSLKAAGAKMLREEPASTIKSYKE